MDINFDEIFQKVKNDTGKINVLIAGRSGVGKSTLINAIFGRKMAEVGQGRPVTKNTREITHEGVPLNIFDTRGLEMEDFANTLKSLEILVKERRSEQDSNRHIHVAWLCIHEDARRVEDAEINLHKMLSEYMPVIAVITKARSDQGFKNEVLNLLPNIRNIVRVRAISEEFDEGFVLPVMGLDTLIDATSEVIPEGKRRAFAAAQVANLKYKVTQSRIAIATAAAAAAAVAAIPIPFSDAFVLAPIQVAMIAQISIIFGMDLTTGSLSTIVTSALGVTGASFMGRSIAANILKMIPVVGTAVGATVNVTIATTITTMLGEAYVTVLSNLYNQNPDINLEPEEIAEHLKKQLQREK